MKKAIGIDIGGTNTVFGLVDEKGKILKMHERSTLADLSKDIILENLKSGVQKVWDKSVKGIGIGFPSIVDVKTGIVYEAPNIPAFKKVSLKKELEKEFKVRVEINNDANCFAFGEKLFGSGKRYKDIVAVTLGTGFGVGVIVNSQIYCGKNCAVGELGGVRYKDINLDYYAGGRHFFLDKTNMEGKELYTLAKKGDKKAKKIFQEYGQNLGYALGLIVSAYNPELIILGGNISKAYPFFKKSMQESINTNLNNRKTIMNSFKVVGSKLKNAGVLGAAALILG